MGPVLAQLRRDLRTQWRSLLALAVLVGLIGGVVLASTMAARRTASAYTRYVDFAHAEDINIGAPGINDPTFAAAVSAIESYPEVAAVGPISSQELLSTEEGLEFFALGGVDDRVGTTINRPKILEGRDADPEAEAEVTVNRSMADALDLVPGDPLTLYGFGGGDSETREDRDVAVEDGRRQVFTVTGISLYPNEVVPTAPLDDAPRVYLTPAQVQAHPNEGEEFAFIAVRLRNGAADAPAFRAHFAELLAGFGVPEDAVPLLEASERTATVQRSIRPQAQALGAFALLVGLTGFVVLGQAYARQLSADAADRRALWALGFSRRQLTATALLRVAVSVTLGAALAAAVGVALAPLALTGPARAADPDHRRRGGRGRHRRRVRGDHRPPADQGRVRRAIRPPDGEGPVTDDGGGAATGAPRGRAGPARCPPARDRRRADGPGAGRRKPPDQHRGVGGHRRGGRRRDRGVHVQRQPRPAGRDARALRLELGRAGRRRLRRHSYGRGARAPWRRSLRPGLQRRRRRGS